MTMKVVHYTQLPLSFKMPVYLYSSVCCQQTTENLAHTYIHQLVFECHQHKETFRNL